MNNKDKAVALMLVELGYAQHRIASLFDVNQGRISELATGQTVARDLLGKLPKADEGKAPIVPALRRRFGAGA